MTDFKEIDLTIEDFDGEEYEAKQYFRLNYYPADSKTAKDSLEDVVEDAYKSLKRNPWGKTQYICEIKKVIRAVPTGGVALQEVDMDEYMNAKRLENKSDE